jgi:molecular chaperone HtpG
MYGMAGMDMSMFGGEELTLVLNGNNNLIKILLKLKDREDKKQDSKLICEQVFDLAMMSHKQLEPDAMTKFIERSNQIITRLAEIEIA